MFDHDNLPQVVGKQSPDVDTAIVHNRNSYALIQAA